MKRKIHEIAAQLGINRGTIAEVTALESGKGGAPCALCEEFSHGAGLRFEESPLHNEDPVRQGDVKSS